MTVLAPSSEAALMELDSLPDPTHAAEVVTRIPSQVQAFQAPASGNPMDILMTLMSRPDVDMDRMERFLGMYERWEAKEAKKAFDAAMAEFKRHPPILIKDKAVNFDTKAGGKTSYKHAELDQVCDKVGGALSQVGITHRWRTAQPDVGTVRVTVILTHPMGHCEETSLECPPDETGGKNTIQGIASAVSYLERYTLLAATGMATGEGDTDGKIQVPLLEAAIKRIEASTDLADCQRIWMDEYKRPELKGRDQQGALLRAKDKRKKELEAQR